MKKLISILLASIMLATSVTAVWAANTTNQAIPALNLNAGDVEWIFAIDRKNETYTGIRHHYYDSLLLENLIGLLNNIGAVTPVKSGKTAEGDIVVKADTRYSYKLESGNILNINVERYQLSENQAQRFTAICKMIKNSDDAEIFPKWIAWMQPSNVDSFKEYQPLIPSDDESIFAVPLEFMTHYLFWYAMITKGERYEPGHTGLKKDKEYHELTINFKSGVVYKIKSNRNILCVESSDKKYGCKYTLDFRDGDYDYLDIRNAYDNFTYAIPSENPIL